MRDAFNKSAEKDPYETGKPPEFWDLSALTGRTRADLAWALGYLHAQERFFQMDLQRRTAAGELSELVGRAALEKDKVFRLHRFRHRAAAVLAAMTSAERQLLDAYVAGVNRGLGDLDVAPFEYLLLLAKPASWTAEDTVLVVLRDDPDPAGGEWVDRAAASQRARGPRPALGRLLVPGGARRGMLRSTGPAWPHQRCLPSD